MKNIKIFDITILANDIKSKKIKLVSENELFEKFKLYFNTAMNDNFNYNYLCCAFKCKYLLEKNYPHSEYILKIYKFIKMSEFLYDKIKRSV